jgi:hypothetical protein
MVFVGLFVVGTVIAWDVPIYDKGGQEIAAWFADNGTRYIASEVVILLGFLGSPLFLMGLATRLWRAEGDPPIFTGTLVAAGVLFAAIGAAFALPHGALAFLEGNVSPDVAALASAATIYGYAFGSATIAIFLGAAAMVVLATRVFWSWLGGSPPCWPYSRSSARSLRFRTTERECFPFSASSVSSVSAHGSSRRPSLCCRPGSLPRSAEEHRRPLQANHQESS